MNYYPWYVKNKLKGDLIMKKLILGLLFLVLIFNSKFTFAEENIIITPDIKINSIQMDEEHIKAFNIFVKDFLAKTWQKEKEFADGDSLVQEVTDIVLVRIDQLPSDVIRYVANLKIEAKRFVNGNALYKKETLLQIVFFDLKDGILVDFYPFEAVDISNMEKTGI